MIIIDTAYEMVKELQGCVTANLWTIPSPEAMEMITS